jgi:hypothetical protein
LDATARQQLGDAMWERAGLLGFPSQGALADASGVARRTVGPLIAGTWSNQPTVKTLIALEDALALTRNTLVSAFHTGDPDPITSQPLASPADPAAWLVQRLSSRGADTDPDWLRSQARRLEGALPAVAKILAALAEVTDEHVTDVFLAQIPADGASTLGMTRSAASARYRRRTSEVQQPLMAEAAGA